MFVYAFSHELGSIARASTLGLRAEPAPVWADDYAAIGAVLVVGPLNPVQSDKHSNHDRRDCTRSEQFKTHLYPSNYRERRRIVQVSPMSMSEIGALSGLSSGPSEASRS